MKKQTLLFACFVLGLNAQVKQTTEKIVLDGKLDDPVWKTAEVISDFRPFANSGKKTLKAKMNFRVLATWLRRGVPGSPKKRFSTQVPADRLSGSILKKGSLL